MPRSYRLLLRYRDGTVGSLRTTSPETIAEWRDRLREARGRLRMVSESEELVMHAEEVVAYDIEEE